MTTLSSLPVVQIYTATDPNHYSIDNRPINDLIDRDVVLANAIDSVQAKINSSVPLTPEDFGAVGDGATDDKTALTDWINALLANTNCQGLMLAKTYATSGSLPDITVSGVRIQGFATYGIHDVGTIAGTNIRAIAGCTGTILTIAPIEGASAKYLHSIVLKGVTFDCNDIAAKGLVTKSMRYCDFDLCVLNASTTGWEMNVSTTLGEATSTQMNRIRYVGKQSSTVGTAGVSLRLKGGANGNLSFNNFEFVDIVHKDTLAIVEENADNNSWGLVRIFQVGGGSATNSIEWRGGTTSGTSCRNEIFLTLSATLAPIAKGTGTYTVGAQNIFIDHLDKDNNTPTPTEETGTTIYDNEWRAYTPTVTAGSGTFTSVAGVGRYLRRRHATRVRISITVTTNGTAASYTRATLPVTSGSSAGASIIHGEETGVTGKTLRGLITQGSSNCDIQDYTGTYLGANGYVLTVSGEYETD